jgi:hypothetical protein
MIKIQEEFDCKVKEDPTMDTRTKRTMTIIIVAILLCVSSFLFAERVISSQTIVVHGYIAERTNVSFTETGDLLFTSNTPGAVLSVVELSGATLLSVVAR